MAILVGKCEYCSKQFNPRPSGHRRKDGTWHITRFCSARCAYDARIKERVEHICGHCRKLFKVRKAASEKGQYQYCSLYCRDASMMKRTKRKCLSCGKEFDAKIHLLGKNRGKCCSVKCKSAYLSEKFRGEKSWLWKGGKYKEYPALWTRYYKTLIKQRDGNKCVICNSSYNLVVHHIDRNKDNCEKKNLITLCRRCHGKEHNGRINTLHKKAYGGYLSW